jgi:hypothetical protein
MPCPSCNHDNRDGAKFCEDSTRKVVSINFADLTGCNDRNLGPEARQRVAAAVDVYDGQASPQSSSS